MRSSVRRHGARQSAAGSSRHQQVTGPRAAAPAHHVRPARRAAGR
eukprot:SAG31_NODE_3683_length_3989_cov_3.622108_7_plen_44_part_01